MHTYLSILSFLFCLLLYFPKISFQKKEGQEVFVDMGVAAFMKKGLGVAIQYETDSQQHIFIKKMEMQGQDIKGKFVFQMQQKQR